MRRMLFNGKMVGVLTILLVLFTAVGVAEEERTDTGGQWNYILADGEAFIDGYMGSPPDDMLVPNEVDGYPVISIGDRAFESLDITSVTIPAGIMRIGVNPFAQCPLKNIYVDSANPVYTATKGVLFDTEQKRLIAYP